jgi:hypothetical protein
MKTTEIWMDLPNFEGLYKISSHGRVLSCPRKIISKQGKTVKNTKERYLKPELHTSGYLRVKLSKDGITKNMRVHYLVYTTFTGEKCKVKHLDGDKMNNRLENLGEK